MDRAVADRGLKRINRFRGRRAGTSPAPARVSERPIREFSGACLERAHDLKLPHFNLNGSSTRGPPHSESKTDCQRPGDKEHTAGCGTG